MIKKHELVNQVLERLEEANVVQDSYESLRADGFFWEYYPQGHCNNLDSSVEGELSCLTEENLAAILALGTPSQGIAYSALWREWGAQGCLRSVPEILNIERVPVLRVRHDSYLSYFRGYRFQNSYDAYGHGSNGESNGDLGRCVDICMRLNHPDFLAGCNDIMEDELAVLCTALVYSYPFEACRGKAAFYKALQNNPEIFDKFMGDTATSSMHITLDNRVTLSVLREKMTKETPSGILMLELPVMDNDNQIATLRLYSTAVQIGWRSNGEYHAYTLRFPQFNYELDEDENKFIDYMWDRLCITLLTLAGFIPNERRIVPQLNMKCDVNPHPFAPDIDCIHGMAEARKRFHTILCLSINMRSGKLDAMSTDELKAFIDGLEVGQLNSAFNGCSADSIKRAWEKYSGQPVSPNLTRKLVINQFKEAKLQKHRDALSL